MYFDRFDVVSAHYAFYCDFYAGMGDHFYMRLCRIQRYFKPSPMWKGFESLESNAKQIYVNLCEKHGFSIPQGWDMLEV